MKNARNGGFEVAAQASSTPRAMMRPFRKSAWVRAAAQRSTRGWLLGGMVFTARRGGCGGCATNMPEAADDAVSAAFATRCGFLACHPDCRMGRGRPHDASTPPRAAARGCRGPRKSGRSRGPCWGLRRSSGGSFVQSDPPPPAITGQQSAVPSRAAASASRR
jgi:hypothetical protein